MKIFAVLVAAQFGLFLFPSQAVATASSYLPKGKYCGEISIEDSITGKTKSYFETLVVKDDNTHSIVKTYETTVPYEETHIWIPGPESYAFKVIAIEFHDFVGTGACTSSQCDVSTDYNDTQVHEIYSWNKSDEVNAISVFGSYTQSHRRGIRTYKGKLGKSACQQDF